MQYLTKKYPGEKYTVLDPNGFVVLMEPRPVALRKLRELGITLPEKILDAKPVPDAQWRAAFVNATAATAVSTREAVELAASEADVELVRRNQEKIESALASLAESVTSINRESDIQKLREFQEAEFQRLVERHGSGLDSVGEAMFREHLRNTAVGRRLAELEAANENSA